MVHLDAMGRLLGRCRDGMAGGVPKDAAPCDM